MHLALTALPWKESVAIGPNENCGEWACKSLEEQALGRLCNEHMDPCFSRFTQTLPVDGDACMTGKPTQLDVDELRDRIVNAFTAHLRGMFCEVPTQPHMVVNNFIRKRDIKTFSPVLKTGIPTGLQLVPNVRWRLDNKTGSFRIKKNHPKLATKGPRKNKSIDCGRLGIDRIAPT